MDFFIRDIAYGISGISCGIYILYLFVKYKKMDYEEIIHLPEPGFEHKIKLRVEKYGWWLAFLGVTCFSIGVWFLSLAFG